MSNIIRFPHTHNYPTYASHTIYITPYIPQGCILFKTPLPSIKQSIKCSQSVKITSHFATTCHHPLMPSSTYAIIKQAISFLLPVIINNATDGQCEHCTIIPSHILIFCHSFNICHPLQFHALYPHKIWDMWSGSFITKGGVTNC